MMPYGEVRDFKLDGRAWMKSLRPQKEKVVVVAQFIGHVCQLNYQTLPSGNRATKTRSSDGPSCVRSYALWTSGEQASRLDRSTAGAVSGSFAFFLMYF